MARMVERGFQRVQRLNETRRTLKIISAGKDSGKTFTGTIQRDKRFEVPTDSSKDPRGGGTLEIAKAGALYFPDQCEIQDMESNEIWKIVDLDFNCPSYSLKFVLQLKTDKDA